MPALGHKGYLALAKESTFGTPVIVSMEFLEALTESIQDKFDKIFPAPFNGRMLRRVVTGKKTVDGSISFNPEPEFGIGLLLKSLLPTETYTTNGTGNGGTHIFTPATALIAGLTAQVGRDIDVVTYTGGQVKKMTFSASEGALLSATADLSFKDATHGATAQTPTFTTQAPLVYHTGTLTLDGTAVNVKSMSVNIDAGLLDGRGKLTSNTIQAQQAGRYSVTGELEMYWDDMTQYSKFLNGTIAALSAEFTGSAIGTSTRSLKIVVPRLAFTGDSPTIGGPGEMMLKMPFTGILDGSGTPNELVQVTLVNSKQLAY